MEKVYGILSFDPGMIGEKRERYRRVLAQKGMELAPGSDELVQRASTDPEAYREAEERYRAALMRLEGRVEKETIKMIEKKPAIYCKRHPDQLRYPGKTYCRICSRDYARAKAQRLRDEKQREKPPADDAPATTPTVSQPVVSAPKEDPCDLRLNPRFVTAIRALIKVGQEQPQLRTDLSLPIGILVQEAAL